MQLSERLLTDVLFPFFDDHTLIRASHVAVEFNGVVLRMGTEYHVKSNKSNHASL